MVCIFLPWQVVRDPKSHSSEKLLMLGYLSEDTSWYSFQVTAADPWARFTERTKYDGETRHVLREAGS